MEMHLDRLRAGIGPPAMKFPFGSAWIPSTAPILSDDAETVQRRPGRYAFPEAQPRV